MGLPGSQGNRGPKGQPVSTTPRQIYTETCHKYCYSSLWTPQPTVSFLKKKQSSSWNKILIIIFDLGWHRGTWLSRDAGNVWTEGEFYHPLPGIPFKPLFMVKNRNVIVRVCLPKRNKQRWDLSVLKEVLPLGSLFLSTRSKSIIIHAHTEVYFCQGAGFSLKATAVSS